MTALSWSCAWLLLAASPTVAGQGERAVPAREQVVLATPMGEAIARAVVAPFEASSGLRVAVLRVQRRAAIDALAEDLARAGADVWWSPEPLSTAALARAGALARLTPPPKGAEAIPVGYHAPDLTWFGFAARARILMVNTELVPEDARPRSMWDQLDPRWKGKLVLARPTSGTALLHLLALEQSLGEPATRRYVDGLLANDCRIAASDTQLAEMIGSGAAALGMTDTSDYRAVRTKGKPVDAIYPDQKGGGTLVIPNTLACLAKGANPTGGRRLLEYMLSGEAEAILARSERGQMPLRKGVPHPADVKGPGEIEAMRIDLEAAAALAETAAARWKDFLAPTPAPSVQQPAATVRLDFDAMLPGKPPEGMTVAQTGDGALGTWEVTGDPTSRGAGRVLTQTDASDVGSRFPLCLWDGLSARDVAVTVSFKTMRGDWDRAAGLLVRYQDPDNYYCCRANSLEDNVRFYKVVDGRRVELGGVDRFAVMEDVWQTLRLEASGSRFRVWMNGACLFEADDDTFRDAGKVGLWLKGDSITSFDDLCVGPPGTRRTFDFEAETSGATPADLVAESVGAGPAAWSVVESPPGAKGRRSVMAGPGEGRRAGMVLLAGDAQASDVSVATRFLAADTGPGMHLAGLVAGYSGSDDHYFLRINLAECNLRLYRVRQGSRKLLGERHHLRFDPSQWHTAQLTVSGTQLEVGIDGERLFVASEDGPTLVGRAGVWATAGGSTLYDQIVVDVWR